MKFEAPEPSFGVEGNRFIQKFIQLPETGSYYHAVAITNWLQRNTGKPT